MSFTRTFAYRVDGKLFAQSVKFTLPPGATLASSSKGATKLPAIALQFPSPVATPTPTPTAAPTPAPTAQPSLDHWQKTLRVNMSRVVQHREYIPHGWESKYARVIGEQIIDNAADTASIEFVAWDYESGGTYRDVTGVWYSLRVGGVVYTAVGAGHSIVFRVSPKTLAPGWLWCEVTSAVEESCLPFPVYVHRNGFVSDRLVKVRGSFLLTESAKANPWGEYVMYEGPATYAPAAVPLAPRVPVAMPLAPAKPEAICATMLTLQDEGDGSPIVENIHGARSGNTRRYYFSDYVKKEQYNYQRAGERGQNSIVCPTHIMRALPRAGKENEPHGWYVSTGTAWFHVSPTGKARILSGKVHKGVLPQWQAGERDIELVGDWSNVAPARRGHNIIWGGCFMPPSLATDDTAQPLQPTNTKPHAGRGPALLSAESGWGAIRKIQFAADKHDAPPVITEWLQGDDFWDIVPWRGKYIASERGANRLVLIDVINDAPVIVETLFAAEEQRPGATRVSAKASNSHVWRPITSQAACRAQTICRPEGLFVQDDLLYVGSHAMGVVRVFDLNTRQKVRDMDADVNTVRSEFVKVSVSDGSFFPRGTVASVTWAEASFQFARITMPDGREYPLGSHLYQSITSGYGRMLNYPSAVGFGNGCMLIGSASQGLLMFDAARVGDKVPTAQAVAGKKEYAARGLELRFGADGYSQSGVAPPWGENANIDAYLNQCGHAKNG